MQGELTLKEGSRIAIIGGGPAGSFFAHFAQKWAFKKGINISLIIFDAKDFLQRGPKGCNLCAGVIAQSLSQKLEEEGIFLPEKRIINKVEGYCLHIDRQTLHLSCPENPQSRIATVFRGNGPRYSTFPENISFDDFLLTFVQDRGAQVISQPVWEIKLPEEKSKPVILSCGKREKFQKYEVDLAVGAFGVNTWMMSAIQGLGFGYKPPSTRMTFQAEFKLGQKNVSKNFGNSIHIYLPKSELLQYATVIPKGDYVTVTLIGKRNASPEILGEFLSLEEIQSKISLQKPHCFCYPKIAISPSKKPFTDRLVIIGDASFSRHYKNGLESAFLTAKIAAEVSFSYGIDKSSFSTHYYERAKKLIIRDNFYGRFLFLINDVISSLPLLTRSHLALANNTSNKAASRKIRAILWNMFTGNIPYRQIFKDLLDLRLQTALLTNTISLLIRKLKTQKLGKESER